MPYGTEGPDCAHFSATTCESTRQPPNSQVADYHAPPARIPVKQRSGPTYSSTIGFSSRSDTMYAPLSFRRAIALEIAKRGSLGKANRSTALVSHLSIRRSTRLPPLIQDVHGITSLGGRRFLES